MKTRYILASCIGAAGLITGVGGAQAKGKSGPTTLKNLRVTSHVRVDGSSDLRGAVHVRGGLRVTAGLTTDTLDTSGPVQMGGVLVVNGGITAASLNTGGGSISTSGNIQGGALTLSGDANVAGNLQLGKTLTAAGVTVGSSGLQASAITAGNISSSGSISAGSISSSGAVTAGSIVDNGAFTAGTGTFSKLAVTSGGTVDFNNATVTGLSLNGATLSSLQISTVSGGGTSGAQALTITQNGKTASLSVDSAGNLAVAGTGLTASTLAVSGNGSVGGTLTTSKITSSSTLTLTAPTVATSAGLQVGASGDLLLTSTGSSSAHLVGNRDTRGQCSANATGSPDVNSCSVTFADSYPSAPVVVVTPVGSDPTFVTAYSVQSSTSGLTIRFSTSGPGTATFNYIVEG